MIGFLRKIKSDKTDQRNDDSRNDTAANQGSSPSFSEKDPETADSTGAVLREPYWVS